MVELHSAFEDIFGKKASLFQYIYSGLVKPICITLSNLFLLLTIVVFAVLPDLRSTVPGKLEMALILVSIKIISTSAGQRLCR
jgi:hypothetical protein